MTGTKVTTEQFVEYLTALREEVARGGSMEGSIRYEWSDEKDVLIVAAACRVGNDQGQGGMMLLHGQVPFRDGSYEEQRAAVDG